MPTRKREEWSLGVVSPIYILLALLEQSIYSNWRVPCSR